MSSRMQAMERESIRVTRSVSCRFRRSRSRVSRSSGPGGQHAQKSSTRVEALFDVEASEALSESQKRRVIARAGPVLRAVAQDERSQLRNRELAIERLVEKLRAALAVPRRRRPTRPTAASRERRLAGKKRRGRDEAPPPSSGGRLSRLSARVKRRRRASRPPATSSSAPPSIR